MEEEMPIQTAKPLRQPTEREFKGIAHDVIGQAFELHSQYGSLFAENIYKHELAARCAKLGYQDVETEFPIELTHKSFEKTLYIDLLIDGSAPFELKVQPEIVEAHRAQTLNYLFLTELPRSKIINFGAATLEHEFVSTRLTHDERHIRNTHDRQWQSLGPECEQFRSLFSGILNDWGGWLTLSLYQEALVHLMGGEEKVVRRIDVKSSNNKSLVQKAHMLSEAVAFKLTCFPGNTDGYRKHLESWLHCTQLDGVQWINLHRRDLAFITIGRTE